MAKRLCSWCGDPMPWWSKLLFLWTCKNCAYRMSMGQEPATEERRVVMRQDAYGNRSQIAGDAPNRFLPTIVLADSTRYALGPSPLKGRHCYGYSPQDQPTEPIPVVPAQPAAESDKPEHPCLLAGAGLLFWSLLMFAAGMVTAGALVSLWWWFG